MAAQQKTSQATFKVLDAMRAPNGGEILRLRLQTGEAPSIRDLKGARMSARSPDGTTERSLRVTGFALLGGRPTDRRLARTGRVDIHVTVDEGDAVPTVSLQWEVSGPVS